MPSASRAKSAIPCCSKPSPVAAAKACASSPSAAEFAGRVARRRFRSAQRLRRCAACTWKNIWRARATSKCRFFGDAHGNIVYLGERECSVQRRHQKVIEEAPSPVVTPELRAEMGEAAVRLARAAGYVNAGTVEFLVDAALNFYFLEVNTRLQVEHPVTEAGHRPRSGEAAIAIAAGEPLPFAQHDVTPRGHAMECRLYAEDPDNNFFPSPGKILSWHAPTGPGIRLDEGVYDGWTVPGDYDPLLGKLIAWGADRAEAIARLRRALREYDVTGIRTNVRLFRKILRDAEFLRGEIHTRWLDQRLHSLAGTAVSPDDSAGRALLRRRTLPPSLPCFGSGIMAPRVPPDAAAEAVSLETRRPARTIGARPAPIAFSQEVNLLIDLPESSASKYLLWLSGEFGGVVGEVRSAC